MIYKVLQRKKIQKYYEIKKQLLFSELCDDEDYIGTFGDGTLPI